MKTVTIAAALAGTVIVAAQAPPSVAYPEGFRSWQHVKSSVIGPDHASFANRGGFHHFYANGAALEGYRTGKFPSGAVIVDEAVVAKNGEERLKGILLEGERRGIDVMVKDDRVYADTGGWGFEHFSGTEKTGTLSGDAKSKCFACHGKQAARDSVFSAIRP
jgi:hypothetical protein